MVNRNVVTSRIEQIDRHLKKLSPYSEFELNRFIESSDAQDIVEYNTFQCINHLIDIMQHVVINEDYGMPRSAYEAAELLSAKDILDETDLSNIKAMIGFRNIVGHDYLSIDKNIVYNILVSGLPALKRIVGKIALRFL